MTKRKNLIASLMLIAVLSFSASYTSFAFTGKTPYSVPAGKITEVTDKYSGLLYDSSKYSDSVVRKLSEVAQAQDYLTLIAELDVPALIDAAGDERVSDIIGSATYNDTVAAVNKSRSEYLRALKKAGIKYEVKASYDTVIAGVAVRIKTADFARAEEILEGLGGSAMVSEVYYEEETFSTKAVGSVTVNDVNVDVTTGIFDSSNVDYDGTGTVVAVLDSGFDYTHTVFTDERAMPAPDEIVMTREVVAERLRATRAYKEIDSTLTVSDVYLSDKIPFEFDYGDDDADVYPLESEHGTHVASIIAGCDDVVTGVAPKAQLVLLKVFSDKDAGAKQSDILRAVEDCVALGVDVMNMSLGMNAGFAREDDTKRTGEIYDKVREAGISLICAASNAYNSTFGSEANGNLPLTSNPDSGTVGSPSTYEAALSVASISGVKTPYIEFNGEPIYYLEASNSAGEEYNFMDMMLGGNESAYFEYVTVPGIGDNGDYASTSVRGKIALVKRGISTFENKIQLAYQNGAIGVIIYNNVSGDIKMNVGNYLADWGLGCISMSQDDGEKLAAQRTGVIKLSRGNLAGPFMSDFSSWGPRPDLGIKPEITAHGGNILAAVPGQDYDRLSGTSMASPNQAGVHTLVRQYVIEHFEEFFPSLDKTSGDGRRAIAALTNQLLMSTTDIARDEFGNPYSVRKQGSGLANLLNAVSTGAYITVDKNGETLDRTKLELGDDPEKTGVYELEFTVHNSSAKTMTFGVNAFVFTETVAKTLTDKDKTVSAERAYMLGDTATIVEASGASGNSVTVSAGGTLDVKVTLKISDAAKKYLDASFENGMYVEGFIRLVPVGGVNNGIAVGAPFLAFYGDWTQAPMFDLTYFETNPDELNDAIDNEDKTKPDIFATRPIGGLESDYIGYMGSYYFMQNPANVQIPAQEEHISLTNNTSGLNYIYGVWAGLLRAAKTVDITIYEETTGKVVFTKTETNIRKTNSNGMSPIDIDFYVAQHNLKNNTRYVVHLDGHLDYERDGIGTNLKNSYEFVFTTDFEAPKVTDIRYYTEYDDVTKQPKLFADIDVYDNHYAQTLRIGVWNGSGLVEEDYYVPVYGDRNSTSTVTVELTDYLKYARDAYPTANRIMLFAYDYAMNAALYEVALPDDIEAIYLEENEVTISVYETKPLEPKIFPARAYESFLDYKSSNEKIAKVVDGTLVGVSKGTATIQISSPTNSSAYTLLKVTVLGEGDPGYRRFDRPIVKSFSITGYHTDMAYYERYSDNRNIGVTGDEVKFLSRGKYLKMFPGEQVTLRYDLKSYFDTEVVFSSSNESIVKVDAVTGRITALSRGGASVQAVVQGTNGVYQETIQISVENPYVTNGPYLTSYKGIGEDNAGNVVIPAKLNITQISEFAFSGSKSVNRDPAEIDEENPYYTTSGPVGDQRTTEYRIKSVYIPEGVKVIDHYAFSKMTALEVVYLPSTLVQINAYAFSGCTALKSVIGLDRVKIISQYAFSGCTSLDNTTLFALDDAPEFKLDAAIAIGTHAFEGTAIRSVVLEKVQSVGAGAFMDCSKLRSLTIHSKIKLDSGVFEGCSSITEIEINAPVISDDTFAACRNLESVTLGADVAEIGTRAFAGTKVAVFKLKNNTTFTGDGTAMLYRDGGKTLVAVAPNARLNRGVLDLSGSQITAIGSGAFSCVSGLKGVKMPNGVSVGDYAFYGVSDLESYEGEVSYVGNYAFAGTSLSILPTFGADMTNIGSYAFAALVYSGIVSIAPQFTEANIPAGVTLGEGAFMGCDELTSVTLNSGVKLGIGAFFACSNLATVTLNADVAISDMAFYNCSSLANIEGSENITSVGAYAFTADYVNELPKIESINLSNATSIGERAFYGNRNLTEITVSNKIELIGYAAFAGTNNLKTVNGSVYAELGDMAFYSSGITSYSAFTNVKKVGAYAFADSELGKRQEGVAGGSTSVNLTKVEQFGEYAFANTKIAKAVLSAGAVIPEGLFYNSYVSDVTGLESAVSVGAYAFANTGILNANLTAAESIGTKAFASSNLMTVTLGSGLKSLGDNPFANTRVGLFGRKEISTDGFNIEYVNYDYDISDTVHVIRGALYCELPAGGLELICYPDAGDTSIRVAEGTVRISDYAAAYNNTVVSVYLPYSLKAVGHGAFYKCPNLSLVSFESIAAPILEAEYDESYIIYDEDDNIVNDSQLIMDKLPDYVHLEATHLSGVLYNNNFGDYVGIARNLTLVYPKNGTGYSTYLFDSYFDHVVVAKVVADDTTRLAIALIDALPRNVMLTDEAAVVAARVVYDQIKDLDQLALVTNISTLTRAESRIAALKAAQNPPTEETPGGTTPGGSEGEEPKNEAGFTVLIVVLSLVCVLLIVAFLMPMLRQRKAAGGKKKGK